MASGLKPTYLDLFSGCGGLSLGFLQAGFTPLLAIDADQHAVDCYNLNHAEIDGLGAVRADIGLFETYDAIAEFLKARGIRAGDCDVLVGGPPCQSFSMVGRTKVRALMEADPKYREIWEKKSETRTMLFEAYVRFLEYLQPRWFLFENVPSIRNHRVFGTIRDRFANLRSPEDRPLTYRIGSDIYWASDYGVPQHRQRFLMVGYRADAGVAGWAAPAKLPAPTVDEALSDLPDVPSGHKEQEMSYTKDPESEFQLRMRTTASGDACATVYNHIGRRHNTDDVALFARMDPGAKFSDDAVQRVLPEINPQHKLMKYSKEKFKDKLHKLDPSRPSWTVTAHLQKDCYKFIHYSQARTITVREAARLQSFPDSFVFPNAMSSAYRLIGNAVPPLLAQAFAGSFLDADPGLRSRDYRVAAILPDETWANILVETERPRQGRPLWRTRAALAAGMLVVGQGRPWLDAERLLGMRESGRLERWLGKLERSGYWAKIRDRLPTAPIPLPVRVDTMAEAQLDFAAD